MAEIIEVITEISTIEVEGEPIASVIEVPSESELELLEIQEQGPPGAPGPQGAQGPQGPPGTAGSDITYTHTQISAQSVWTVNHNLNKYPSVTVVDSGETVVIGDVDYTNANTLTIEFSAAFGGRAYLN